jgi:hypothetical protein
MPNYTVRYLFNSYVFPVVNSISDPKEATKDTIIEGTRGDGSIVIPAGKKSQTITLKGYLINHAGYVSLIADKAALEAGVPTSVGTFSAQHWNGSSWTTDYTYTVKRIAPITYDTDTLRTDYLGYTVELFIIAY